MAQAKAGRDAARLRRGSAASARLFCGGPRPEGKLDLPVENGGRSVKTIG